MKKPQKKQILFASIIVVVVGISVTAAVLFSQYQASIRPPKTNTSQGTSRDKPTIEKKADEAVKRAYEGDVAGGTAAIDEAINDTGDKHEKYILYSNKATLLYNSQDLPGALAAAIKAYELVASSDSAALVGQFSQESGNKPQAIEYYKKAVQLVDKADPYAEEDSQYYQSRVSELEGGAANG